MLGSAVAAQARADTVALYTEAVMTGDIPALETLLAPNYWHTTPMGIFRTKSTLSPPLKTRKWSSTAFLHQCPHDLHATPRRWCCSRPRRSFLRWTAPTATAKSSSGIATLQCPGGCASAASAVATQELGPLRRRKLRAKTAALCSCAVKRWNERAVNLENAYSQRESALVFLAAAVQ